MLNLIRQRMPLGSLLGISLLATLLGCAHTVPLRTDVSRDLALSLPGQPLIPAKVGIYISEDLKHYVYSQRKLGMLFRMNVGEYLVPISRQMVGSLFQDAVYVSKAPPYYGTNKPDVEAVVVPEVLYCYGNAVGIASGVIEAAITIRITAYDLSGNVVWQDERTGTSQSSTLNFVTTFLTGLDEVGRVAYVAAFRAALSIIKDFEKAPPKELYSLLQIKRLATFENVSRRSDYALYKYYYQKGLRQFTNKNYFQALYSFERAERLAPDDLSTRFYLAVCRLFTGDKEQALDGFREVARRAPRSQEGEDSKRWVERLREPLKVGLLFSPGSGGMAAIRVIAAKASEPGIHEMVVLGERGYRQATVAPTEMERLFAESRKQDMRIILVVDIHLARAPVRLKGGISEFSVGTRDFGADKPLRSGDIATEYTAEVSVRAFSTNKDRLISEFVIKEHSGTMAEKNQRDESGIYGELLAKAGEKLAMALLRMEIY
jgi:tetratricopeptide (TPR) repeat protein